MKILFVLEKPSVKRRIKEVLEKYNNEFKDEYFFDYINPVFHMNDKVLLFRKYNDKIYQMGKKSDFIPLNLTHLEIPNNTFIELKNIDFSYSYKKDDFIHFDKILSICDPDDYGILEFAKYLEVNNIPYENAKCFYLNDFDDETIANTLKSSPMEFNDIFKSLCEKLKKTNFACQYPKQKYPLNLRMESGLNRKEFSNYLNIPYRTIENWEKNKAKCPEYLYDLIEYKLEKEGMFRHN